MHTRTLEVRNEVGLHARPAALFVQTAHRFGADIKIRNKTTGTAWVPAKSILKVMTLGVSHGHHIELSAEGPDAVQALETIQQLVDSNFGEAGQ